MDFLISALWGIAQIFSLSVVAGFGLYFGVMLADWIGSRLP